MPIVRAVFCILIVFGSMPVSAATDCTRWSRFAADEAYLQAMTLPPGAVDAALNSSEFSSGLQIRTELKRRELWIDLVHFPGEAPVITATAAVMKVARLVDADFDRLVLSDAGQPIFALDEAVAREIGCQFIWGRTGGENPIHLLRILTKNLKRYDTGAFVTRGFTGHLLGDTTLAMDVVNTVLTPEWALSAVQ